MVLFFKQTRYMTNETCLLLLVFGEDNGLLPVSSRQCIIYFQRYCDTTKIKSNSYEFSILHATQLTLKLKKSHGFHPILDARFYIQHNPTARKRRDSRLALSNQRIHRRITTSLSWRRCKKHWHYHWVPFRTTQNMGVDSEPFLTPRAKLRFTPQSHSFFRNLYFNVWCSVWQWNGEFEVTVFK